MLLLLLGVVSCYERLTTLFYIAQIICAAVHGSAVETL